MTESGLPRIILLLLKRLIKRFEKLDGSTKFMEEGLYRISGGKVKAEKIIKILESNQQASIEELPLMDIDGENVDVHDIARVIKAYFAQLPRHGQILMSQGERDSFLSTVLQSEEKTREEATLNLVHGWSIQWRRALQVMFTHLLDVAKDSGINLMTKENLCIVFAPTLFPSFKPIEKMVEDNGAAKGAMVYLLNLFEAKECAVFNLGATECAKFTQLGLGKEKPQKAVVPDGPNTSKLKKRKSSQRNLKGVSSHGTLAPQGPNQDDTAAGSKQIRRRTSQAELNKRLSQNLGTAAALNDPVQEQKGAGDENQNVLALRAKKQNLKLDLSTIPSVNTGNSPGQVETDGERPPAPRGSHGGSQESSSPGKEHERL